MNEMLKKMDDAEPTMEIPANISESHKYLIEKLGLKEYQLFLKKEKEVEKPVCEDIDCVAGSTEEANYLLVDMDLKYYTSKWEEATSTLEKVDVCVEGYNEARSLVSLGKKLSHKGKKCSMHRQLYNYAHVCECLKTCFRGNKKVFASKFSTKKGEKKKSLVPSKFTCAKYTDETHSPNFHGK